MSEEPTSTVSRETLGGPAEARLELIAAFIDGTLDDARRRELLSLLADDEDAYEVFVGAVEFLRQEAERERVARRRRRLLALVALVGVVAALLFFVWRAV